MDVTVEAFLESYRTLGLGGTTCSAAEVAVVERGSGVILPACYIAYLLVAGRQPPSFWFGSDCTIQYLPSLRGWAEELLAENGQPDLPPRAFVFFMHQGYQFLYFIADGFTDDPPVFYYLEGEAATVQKSERFSNLIAFCLGRRPTA